MARSGGAEEDELAAAPVLPRMASICASQASMLRADGRRAGQEALIEISKARALRKTERQILNAEHEHATWLQQSSH